MSRLPTFSILKHKISIVENINTSELSDAKWQEICDTFAAIQPLFDHSTNSIENFDFGHVITEGYFMFTIRSLRNISTKMRIIFKERIFEIKRVIDPHETGRLMQIIALEIY